MSCLTRYLSRLLGVAPAMVNQPALLWVSGMITFASGLAIVLGHNV
jgi:hypothetical protein